MLLAFVIYYIDYCNSIQYGLLALHTRYLHAACLFDILSLLIYLLCPQQFRFVCFYFVHNDNFPQSIPFKYYVLCCTFCHTQRLDSCTNTKLLWKLGFSISGPREKNRLSHSLLMVRFLYLPSKYCEDSFCFEDQYEFISMLEVKQTIVKTTF